MICLLWYVCELGDSEVLNARRGGASRSLLCLCWSLWKLHLNHFFWFNWNPAAHHIHITNKGSIHRQATMTNACTFMVKETIQYYLQNGNNVYGTVFDATKAFDRIDFCKLFREMIIRKIPPLVIRLYMEMYEKQSMAVQWNNEYSDSFGVSNGVKQGGVLSPILFCIYI